MSRYPVLRVVEALANQRAATGTGLHASAKHSCKSMATACRTLHAAAAVQRLDARADVSSAMRTPTLPRHLIWICLLEQTGQRGGGGSGGQQSSSGDYGEGGGGGMVADAQEAGSGKAPAGTAAARLARMALQVSIRILRDPSMRLHGHAVDPAGALTCCRVQQFCHQRSTVNLKTSRCRDPQDEGPSSGVSSGAETPEAGSGAEDGGAAGNRSARSRADIEQRA